MTRVGPARSTARTRAGRIFDGDPGEAAAWLARALIERGILRVAPAAAASPDWPKRPAAAAPVSLWVLAEAGLTVTPLTRALLSLAVELAYPRGLGVEAIVAGPADPPLVRELAGAGADRIFAAGPAVGELHPEQVATLLAAAIERCRPVAVLLPATVAGREIAARVAGRLDLGLVSDAENFVWDEAGRLVAHRPALGGDLLVPVRTSSEPFLATVRPGARSVLPPDPRRTARIESSEIALPASRVRVVRREIEAAGGAPGLETAPIVIGIGRGVGSPENYGTIEILADVLGAAIGGTRKVTDAGWLPRTRQIGLTGRTIAPRFYLAIGVRGVSHHAVGIRRAETIAVINDNPKSGIFSQADLGVVGDWSIVVPALTSALRSGGDEPANGHSR